MKTPVDRSAESSLLDERFQYESASSQNSRLRSRSVFAITSLVVAFGLGFFLLSSERKLTEKIDPSSVPSVEASLNVAKELPGTVDKAVSFSPALVEVKKHEEHAARSFQDHSTRKELKSVDASGVVPVPETRGKDSAVPVSPQPAKPESSSVSEVATDRIIPPSQPRKPVARCTDGTYSYRLARGETCNSRGGVAELLGDADLSDNPRKPSAPARAYILGPRGGCYFVDAKGSKEYVGKSFCGR